MDKIPRTAWTALADKLPEDGVICLISDGDEVALATSRVPGWGRAPLDWNGMGFSGYEWEWDFEPTHWMAFSVELP
jgi:hypothetical protein